MLKYYLDFEKPIKELDTQILELEMETTPSKTDSILLEKLKAKRLIKMEKIYSKLSRWQRVQLARHPKRPYSLDYIKYFSPEFIELHGDRYFMDDPAVVTGIGKLGDKKVVYVGQQKGRNTKENLYRNFGMMRPEGYRKALRIMKLAEKFNLPIITLIDTIGAYPGIGAEERGQGEAIARNLMEMSGLSVPILSVVIGEGASGGALGIAVCDKMLMLENTWFSVISPEGCASILYHDAKKAEVAAESLKPTPKDLVELGICDRIIKEPNGGAHRDFEASASELKKVLLEELDLVSNNDPSDFLENRVRKYDKLGYYQETA
ncbi:MAG: acetyl-CoA carboxylase carboxyltransferase subunit alpha [Candidatus Marinimicrobia bacterium]|jgi:acetyl-CoA carboxylase carboxyl transferase subunit alpha|nr:acetyl-CoA carboxylase carboxyltransferase subunit alpha [Candidatus Neomarinimicrobiota bacterium]MBT3501463.1 acetyl-CoA carboxylase carboxyltransferase subunit alpha [Candidatus Neomarinimicrobiota bacterium]MBT3839398.1 acetyl-CoA carboxylase carboxyltransferase subunit alpha [Candidatus Neomarinimicrobiota bacterium]MBT3998887.1 acetyl-CoA carboxylase carboxyltransferase subunit alpha [Candidatus Neomarinimicrobiota bacterium]MBT4283089.1 acetyl-CoA carboxylase carboxyltransferase subun